MSVINKIKDFVCKGYVVGAIENEPGGVSIQGNQEDEGASILYMRDTKIICMLEARDAENKSLICYLPASRLLYPHWEGFYEIVNWDKLPNGNYGGVIRKLSEDENI